MKKLPALVLIFFTLPGVAQYDAQKITSILTSGSSLTWTVQGVNVNADEKSYTFRTDKSVDVQPAKAGSKTVKTKWSLSTSDNIRWFITIGENRYELIISFDKKGQRYLKLNRQPDRTRSVYYEIILYPLNKQINGKD